MFLNLVDVKGGVHEAYPAYPCAIPYFLLLPPIRAAEIVECVHKCMDRSSQNLQSLSSY